MDNINVGLSPLRHHKKNHKFKDTPTDTCRCLLSTETTEHFLLYCNLYAEARDHMFQVINPILESNSLRMPINEQLKNLLLYGHDTLGVDENSAVLTATLKFIHKSTRFELASE